MTIKDKRTFKEGENNGWIACFVHVILLKYNNSSNNLNHNFTVNLPRGLHIGRRIGHKLEDNSILEPFKFMLSCISSHCVHYAVPGQ